MIRCRISHLEARCRERGYTLKQVQGCIVSRDGDQIIVDETHADYPHAKPGLGDHVASALSAVGITKERVSKALGRPCGCKQRQQKMTDWGRKWLGIGGPG
ncbi:MAG: hypothetical protein O3A60_02705 [Planctomycetota bacterium]|jgi:hypothetical protein|nr:hypothetical protein [Planctomycetota bacterium]